MKIALYLEYFLRLLNGLRVTLILVALGIALGFILGFLLAIVRVYGGKIISLPALIYTELFRGTPLLVQLFILYYGLPSIGIKLDRFTSVILALFLNSAAYQCEYFRGAIESIPGGQMLAARSIGMSKLKAIRNVILPQALRLSIPSWSNEVILLLKATSVAFTVGVHDLLSQGKIIVGWTYKPFEIFLIVAVIYVVVVVILSMSMDMTYEKYKLLM